MRKQWVTWALVVAVLASPLLLMGIKCNPNQPDATLEEEAQQQQQEQQQGTPTNFTKQSLEKTGVPVYPSTDDGLSQLVTINKNGEYYGSVVLHSSTCPPENVAMFYDSMLAGKPGYNKSTSDGNITYEYTAENGDKMTILITSGGEGPMGGSNITVLFNQ
jgi:hypothetical protein